MGRGGPGPQGAPPGRRRDARRRDGNTTRRQAQQGGTAHSPQGCSWIHSTPRHFAERSITACERVVSGAHFSWGAAGQCAPHDGVVRATDGSARVGRRLRRGGGTGERALRCGAGRRAHRSNSRTRLAGQPPRRAAPPHRRQALARSLPTCESIAARDGRGRHSEPRPRSEPCRRASARRASREPAGSKPGASLGGGWESSSTPTLAAGHLRTDMGPVALTRPALDLMCSTFHFQAERIEAWGHLPGSSIG